MANPPWVHTRKHLTNTPPSSSRRKGPKYVFARLAFCGSLFCERFLTVFERYFVLIGNRPNFNHFVFGEPRGGTNGMDRGLTT